MLLPLLPNLAKNPSHTFFKCVHITDSILVLSYNLVVVDIDKDTITLVMWGWLDKHIMVTKIVICLCSLSFCTIFHKVNICNNLFIVYINFLHEILGIGYCESFLKFRCVFIHISR